MREDADTSAGNPGLLALIEQLSGRCGRVAVADYYHMFLACIASLQFVVGHLQVSVQAGHVTHCHPRDGRDDSLLVARLSDGEDPIARPTPPSISQDADQIQPAQSVHGGDGHLLAPVISLRHFAGMHNQDQSSLGQLLFLRRIQIDRKDIGYGRTYPPAGPKGFGAPHHNQSASEVGDKATKHFLLLKSEVAATCIDQNHGVRVHESGQIVREVDGRAVPRVDVGILQGPGQSQGGRTVGIHDENVTGPGDIRNGTGPVVLNNFILARLVGHVYHLELMYAARSHRHGNRLDVGARLQFHRHGDLRRVRDQIDGLAV